MNNGTDLARLTLLAASLAVASPAWADCTNDAGSGDIAEGEPCLIDLATNHTDDGCNRISAADADGNGVVRSPRTSSPSSTR